VKGEPGVPDPAVSLGFVKEISNADLPDRVPEFTNEGMDEIIINMVCLELLQLGIQELIHILPFFYEP